jgi:CDP-diacylglycerol---glycerol-3-phosphate 3-phosphatidyltransferase
VSASTIRQDIVNVPNLLTLFRIVLIPITVMFIYYGDPLSCFIAVLLFSVASITDWLDGYIARKQGLVSLTGKFLDPLADKLLVMAALVMLVPLGRIPAWIVIVILAREFSISGLRSLAAGEGLIIAAGEGGKFKTAFQMTGLVALIVHYTYEINYLFFTVKVNFHQVGLVLLLISVFYSLWSAWDYFRGFLHAMENQRPQAPSS